MHELCPVPIPDIWYAVDFLLVRYDNVSWNICLLVSERKKKCYKRFRLARISWWIELQYYMEADGNEEQRLAANLLSMIKPCYIYATVSRAVLQT